MDYKKIQEEVKALHKELWQNKELLWPGRSITPIQMLEPAVAAHVLGVEYVELPDLGNSQFSFRGQQFKVAGSLDRQLNRIAVSTEFERNTIRFTAAHEIGHWELHPDEVMHRDRPIAGLSTGIRDRKEKEADYYAACYLMPARLVADTFSKLFRTDIPLAINETVAFHLNPQDHQSLLLADSESLDRELAVARCESFAGQHFHSLSKYFRVSDLAMALRIKELKLIRWP